MTETLWGKLCYWFLNARILLLLNHAMLVLFKLFFERKKEMKKYLPPP